MIPTVTVGLDTSKRSLNAADWAAAEAERRGLPLRLIHIKEARPHAWPDPAAGLADEVAERLRARHPGLAIRTDDRYGQPSTVLSTAAAESALLVLGSRGLGGMTGLLLGSVSRATVARTTRPVVLVRTRDEAADGRRAGEVVLGLDLSRPCDALISFAFEAAAHHATTLRVVHVWQPPTLHAYSPEEAAPDRRADLGARRARTLNEALRPWRARHPGVEVTEEVLIGHPTHHLVRAAAGAALLVVGRRTREAALGPRIGPVTHAALHHSPAPVAVVPHD
ncbi:universal stress protein [Streptomyces radicis]|uniref:Universal stress protein n=1 Tax=Streptomyces radicis TaxID=1750517 RepID=A0A3A9VRW7_9ACTN|nr:universal stress protein [Streptomyces radicis]RKN03785.1 universal stress protein [Streptomyces radicis]RKN13844.1 universal stress protein [Streptomyces radicis]